MLNRRRTLIPQSLKYRLFSAFVMLILLPFCALNIYNYQNIETLVQKKISQQSHSQLEQMYRTLEDQMSIAFKTLIFLEQDSTVRSILQHPELRPGLENKRLMEEKFKTLNNSFFLYNPSVYFTILDFNHSVYTSYPPKEALNYERLRNNSGFNPERMEKASYHWVSSDENYVFRDVSTSPYLLSLYAYMKDRYNEPYGMARISIDYSFWFQSVLKQSTLRQEYFLITSQGDNISQSVQDSSLSAAIKKQIVSQEDSEYFTDKASDTLINYIYVESLDWYIVNRIPLSILFTEIEELKRQYFVTFFILMGAFILMTFIIASTITRPLSHLQNKMREVVRKNLKVRLPEQKFRGEILELTRTFNTMLDDTNELIRQLKAEERQKEAVHFQMLLAQMNPHFLLNTLNTIKWIAIREKNEDITNMTLSLGKLLEASLSTEKDLVYLKDELELVQAYVHIQQIRHNYQFKITYHYEEQIQYALVPKLSLQPLIENSIMHGVGDLLAQGRIEIRIYRIGHDKMAVEVEDNGIGMDQSRRLQRQAIGRKRPGIGLSNVRERLKLLFKEQGSMEIMSSDDGTLIRYTIPFLLSTPYVSEPGKEHLNI